MSPIGFLGVSLVVLGCVCGWGVLLVVLDCGCGWEVSRKVLCGVSLVVFDRGFGWEVVCWEVAWRGFFLGVMGFTHPQPNFANSIRLRKEMKWYVGSMLA